MLAATLGANYGIYSGFELCENVPVRAGQRGIPRLGEVPDPPARLRRRPSSLAELIARVNAIRRAHPALQFDCGLRFHRDRQPAADLLTASDPPDGSDLILVVVNLDPLNMQHGYIELPLADWKLPPTRRSRRRPAVGRALHWRGEWNYVRLDPQDRGRAHPGAALVEPLAP